MDYSYFYKKELPVDSEWGGDFSHDVFISAFNSSERVAKVFEKAEAKQKYWLVFPEYDYSDNEMPKEHAYRCSGDSEGEQIVGFFDGVAFSLGEVSICIDITGFMRPQLAFLLKYLYRMNVKTLDLIYSEPIQYVKKEKTNFSGGSVSEVRQIMGFEGAHKRDTSNDLLVIGSGYDYHLIKSVCNHKEHAKTKQLIGFPSLRPDMYQENMLKTALASDALGEAAMRGALFAPASDPFVTAEVLSKALKRKVSSGNIYLCPLSTKPQTVGFILYYLRELQDKAVSIISPFFASYERETSKGVNKIWAYTVEFSG